MCGITGFNWEDKDLIKKMTDLLSHRGPDQHNCYTDSKISLGHRRLSIIDLSENGKQPMSNEDNTIFVIYNGEIYNFKSIREELIKKGHKFKSNSDTEIIIHAYEEYGPTCVNLFNGMFAFAIWDSKKKKIFIARDRLGIKPLYYYYKDNKLIFASELKAILKNPEVKKQLNLSGLNQLIYYAYPINGETLIEGINELLPGHLMIYDYNQLIIHKYWEPKNNIQYESESYFAKRLKSTLKESVRKRLVADVPLGASLSGGLDSAAIVAFMSQLTNNPVKTFTVGFGDESDELSEAKEISDYCNTDHHEIIVDFKDITKNIPKILWNAETPFAKPAMYATYFLAEGIRKNNVIIDLSGEGSDEIFGGYNRYLPFIENQLSNKEKAKQIVSSYFPKKEEKNSYFNSNLAQAMHPSLKPENNFYPSLERTSEKEHLNTVLNFEIRKQLPGIHLLRVDKMSMAHSHEIRVPFLDHDVVELAMTIPSSLKWHQDGKKYILQKAMQGSLPNEVIKRKKLPFHMPYLKYFQEEFVDISQSILEKSTLLKKIANHQLIMNKIKKIKSKEDTSDSTLRQITFLTNLELFNKIFIEDNNNLELNNFI
jgi:asparagine synthase (glutamine-hydrolysing)